MMTAGRLIELREAGKINDYDYLFEIYKLATPEQRDQLMAKAREIYKNMGWEWPEEC
jgi:hypothetical protein